MEITFDKVFTVFFMIMFMILGAIILVQRTFQEMAMQMYPEIFSQYNWSTLPSLLRTEMQDEIFPMIGLDTYLLGALGGFIVFIIAGILVLLILGYSLDLDTLRCTIGKHDWSDTVEIENHIKKQYCQRYGCQIYRLWDEGKQKWIGGQID